MLKRALAALSPTKRHPYAVKPFRAASHSHSSVKRSMRGGYLPHTGEKEKIRGQKFYNEDYFPNGQMRAGSIVQREPGSFYFLVLP